MNKTCLQKLGQPSIKSIKALMQLKQQLCRASKWSHMQQASILDYQHSKALDCLHLPACATHPSQLMKKEGLRKTMKTTLRQGK